MAMESIQKVTEVERDSQKRRDEAQLEARRVVTDAHKAGQQAVEDARKQAAEQGKRAMADAEEEAAHAAAAILEQSHQQCEELKRSARARLERAAGRIVERVVNG